MKSPQIILDLNIGDDRWRKIPRLKNQLEAATSAVLKALPKHLRFSCQFTLLLTTNSVVRRLNRDFRGIDKPTNVLSFPQFEKLKSVDFSPKNGVVSLGDIAIGYQYVVAESKNDHKILINHLVHLMIHGILHLFGYDHEFDHEANTMERLEKKIMKQLGRPNPYAAPIEPTRHNHPQRMKQPPRHS